jgi:hypothetical protein
VLVVVLGHGLAVLGLSQVLVVNMRMGVDDIAVAMLVLVLDVSVVMRAVAVGVAEVAVRMLVAVGLVVRVFPGIHLALLRSSDSAPESVYGARAA